MLSERFLPFFTWCGETWLGTTVRDTVWAFPVIETFHLLALAVLLGSILIVNLRAFGIGASQPRPDFSRWITLSIIVLIASGIPMMMSEPMKCYESVSFPIKIALLLIGILWHYTVQRKWSLSATSSKAKLAAIISILIWAGIGIAGKGIPYV